MNQPAPDNNAKWADALLTQTEKLLHMAGKVAKDTSCIMTTPIVEVPMVFDHVEPRSISNIQPNPAGDVSSMKTLIFDHDITIEGGDDAAARQLGNMVNDDCDDDVPFKLIASGESSFCSSSLISSPSRKANAQNAHEIPARMPSLLAKSPSFLRRTTIQEKGGEALNDRVQPASPAPAQPRLVTASPSALLATPPTARQLEPEVGIATARRYETQPDALPASPPVAKPAVSVSPVASPGRGIESPIDDAITAADMQSARRCRMVYQDGSSYVGESKDGQREGRGTMYYKHNVMYEGEWKANVRHGFGKLSQKDDVIYEGYWANDRLCGNGTLNYCAGMVDLSKSPTKEEDIDQDYVDLSKLEKFIVRFEGNFKDGDRHGFGTAFYRNGAMFNGYFSKNKANGIGKFTKSTKEDITGNWQDNQLKTNF